MSNKTAHTHNQQHQQPHQHQQQQPQHQQQQDDKKRNTERNRKISQYSRDIHNVGHSHFSHPHSHSDKDSQKARHEGGDSPPKVERHRRISQYSRDGAAKGHHGGRPRAGSKREHDRHSVATSGDLHAPPIDYENTYRLEPDSVFRPAQVRDVIKQVLHEHLHGKPYIHGAMGDACLTISDAIKERVRQLDMHRFKIVSTVLIGERKSQSMQVSSRCLWNQNHDNFASCVYDKGNLCAVGMVFAVYQE